MYHYYPVPVRCPGTGRESGSVLATATRNRHSGLTLVELMIAVSLASLVMVGIAAATITVGRMLYRNMAEAEITQSMRVVEGSLARDVRSARQISLSGDTLSIELAAGGAKYQAVQHRGGHTELIRTSDYEATRRYFLRNVNKISFSVAPSLQPELFMQVHCHIQVGGGNDVQRTFFTRFASRIQ